MIKIFTDSNYATPRKNLLKDLSHTSNELNNLHSSNIVDKFEFSRLNSSANNLNINNNLINKQNSNFNNNVTITESNDSVLKNEDLNNCNACLNSNFNNNINKQTNDHDNAIINSSVFNNTANYSKFNGFSVINHQVYSNKNTINDDACNETSHSHKCFNDVSLDFLTNSNENTTQDLNNKNFLNKNILKNLANDQISSDSRNFEAVSFNKILENSKQENERLNSNTDLSNYNNRAELNLCLDENNYFIGKEISEPLDNDPNNTNTVLDTELTKLPEGKFESFKYPMNQSLFNSTEKKRRRGRQRKKNFRNKKEELKSGEDNISNNANVCLATANGTNLLINKQNSESLSCITKRSFIENAWVHMSCALWIHDVLIEDFEKKENIKSI